MAGRELDANRMKLRGDRGRREWGVPRTKEAITHLPDLLLKYLPASPATVILVGDEATRDYTHLLKSNGYRVFHHSISAPLACPFTVIGKRCSLPDTTRFPIDEESDGTTIMYDAIFWVEPSGGFASLVKPFNEVGQLLREEGVVLSCHGVAREPVTGKHSEIQQKSDIVSALYEAGFVIQVNEVINLDAGDKRVQERQGRRCHFLVGKKNGIIVRSYEKGDEVEILSMFKEVFHVYRTLEHWYWKFRDNPFGGYRIAEAFGRDGRLAGHYSGYPVPFHASFNGGQRFISYQIGDIMTRPCFRQVGLATTSILGRVTDYFHHKFCFDTVPFMYGFITGNHKRFGERFLGYTYLYEIPYYVALPCEFLLNGKKRTFAHMSGLSVKKSEKVTPEFDSLFERVSGDYGLLVKRDASYLKWRYLDCPDRLHTLFALRRFGSLMGWGVFSRRGDVMVWGDALFQKGIDALAIKYLIHQVINRHFPDVIRIEGWFSRVPLWWTQLLNDVGFTCTDEPNGLVSGVTNFDESFCVDTIRKNLYYTMGDSDLF